MTVVNYSPEALDDFDRLTTFLIDAGADNDDNTARTIIEAISILADHPFIGRPAGRFRELVIAFGRAGYIATYRVTQAGVEVLRIRHQRQAGPKL